jgi:hypothetical protein
MDRPVVAQVEIPEKLPVDGIDTISQSIGGIGVSPVPPQAKACGYHKLLFDCNSV